VDWNTDGITGARRFLNRVWNLVVNYWQAESTDPNQRSVVDIELARTRHYTIRIVTERIETFRFNTMISALMEFVNTLYEQVKADQWQTTTFQECLKTVLILLAPAAPYITEELWDQTEHDFSVHQQSWPKYDEALAHVKLVEIPVQVNGKMRGTIQAEIHTSESEALQTASESPEIQKHLHGKEIVRVIYVPGKILNVVIKPGVTKT
jgi:leucyl-tRNA synthetase